jgi:hypothetical protein
VGQCQSTDCWNSELHSAAAKKKKKGRKQRDRGAGIIISFSQLFLPQRGEIDEFALSLPHQPACLFGISLEEISQRD